jgi:competence protein ComEA
MKKLTLLFWLGCLALAPAAFAAPVNINTADAQTIADSLKGIGLKKAEAIVKYRTEKGPFKAVEELTNVNGIGEKTIEKNKADIQLSGTPAAPVAPAAPAGKKTP